MVAVTTFICKWLVNSKRSPCPVSSSAFKLQHYIHLNPPLRSRPISLSYQAALTHFPPVYTLVMGVCEDRRPATGIGRRSSHTPHYKCVQCFSSVHLSSNSDLHCSLARFGASSQRSVVQDRVVGSFSFQLIGKYFMIYDFGIIIHLVTGMRRNKLCAS